MYKEYPYLQDSFVYQTDVEREKRNLLNEIDSFLNQRQYVKITLLNWDEEPIRAIEGEISSGSISKVGDSPIRRTAQLTCAVDARSYSVDDGKADFAINKKVFIEIGVKNETPHYPEYPIFWFPEGVFFIGSFSINSGANSSTNITLSLKDKMAMLNGDVGGTLPATTIFDSMDTQLPNGEYIEKKVLIYNIIQELVHHYGGEDLNRIVIEGVPFRIRRIMQWNGDEPVYQIHNVDIDTGLLNPIFSFTPEDKEKDLKYVKGNDIGYIMDDFVILDELTGAPGESVTSVLDKIKNILGNYEYYYDVFGTFHFREIKNYYVTTQARTLLDEMAENDYLVETNNSRSIYTFDDEKLLTSINVTPQYENIKNDYIVEGQTSIADSDITVPIRYHLAIDKKPDILGRDKRTNINPVIDNTGKIEAKKQELDNLLKKQNNNLQELEQLLFDIRNAKTYIKNKDELIDIKDKELLKQLQDIWHTTYTYVDLANEEKLLSEQWLEKYLPDYNIQFNANQVHPPENISTQNINTILNNEYLIKLPIVNNNIILNDMSLVSQTSNSYDHIMNIQPIISQDSNNLLLLNDVSNFYLTSNSLKYFINNAVFPDILDIQSQIAQIIDNKNEIYARGQHITHYIDTINSDNTNTTDIIKKIYEYAGDVNYPVNQELYTAATDALKIIQGQLQEQETQLQILQEQENQLNQRYKNIRNNLLTLYNFILQLQEQRKNKLNILDGVDGIILGIENNHENLNFTNDENNGWFSYNTDKVNLEDTTIEDNQYTFVSNDILLTITLDTDNNFNFYDKSLFGEFYKAFIKYHNTDNSSLNDKIQSLQNEIDELEKKNGTISENEVVNPNYNRAYYDIYPMTESEMILYTHPRNSLVCGGYVEEVQTLPSVGNFNLIYKNNSEYYYWNGQIYETLIPLDIYDSNNPYYAYDWRTKLYLDGLKSVINGTDAGYYYAELSAFWPQIYNLRTQKFYAEEKDKSIDYETLAIAGSYYLDFLDEVDTSFGEWSVNNIGRRSDVVVKEEINCLFQPEIPNVILLPSNAIELKNIGKNMANETYRYGSSLESDLTLEELRQEARRNFYPYSQVSSEIYNNLITGGYRNGAFDQIKYELYLHTRYQKSISLTAIPVFYLEPNNRITINDTTTNTYGDYVIQSINLTLGSGANMSITCNETAERF